MPICPCCGKRIDELIAYRIERNKYRVRLDNTKEHLIWEMIDTIKNDKVSFFACPECRNGLFKTDKEAVTFLKSETKEKCPFHPENGGNCSLADSTYCRKGCHIRWRYEKQA